MIIHLNKKKGVLKDVPDFPLLMVYNKERDAKRMALYPSLDYRGLFAVLVQLLDVIPLVQTGIEGFVDAMINGSTKPMKWRMFSYFLQCSASR